MTIEAMKHYEAALLEAFPRGASGDVFEHWNKARQAIEQAEKQEPVAWRFQSPVGGWAYGKEPPIGSKYAVEPLYTVPQPQREWVGLTDEEADELVYRYARYGLLNAIEAKLKEKNT